MSFWSGFAPVVCLTGALIVSQPSFLSAQASPADSQVIALAELPDAPQPQNQDASQTSPAAGATQGQDQSQGQDQNGQSTSTQVQAGHSAEQTASQRTDEEKANEQVKQQEKQRVLGIVPNFNLTYLGNQTVSLTVKQKFDLAFHAAIDPVSFVIPFFVAGYNEMLDSDQGFPWGVKGLGERAGAAYLDSFDGNMLGNAILPSILHQDPRYYRLGHGTTTHRILYAASTSFICKHDKTGKWEPNYSNVGGNILGGAISNLYYPPQNTGVGLTISTGFIVTAEGAIGAEFDEFWPDISRHFLHRDPTHGLDAQRKAEDEKKKGEAKQQ